MSTTNREEVERAAFIEWAATEGITNVVFAPVSAVGRTLGNVSGQRDHHLVLLDREWAIWQAALSRPVPATEAKCGDVPAIDKTLPYGCLPPRAGASEGEAGASGPGLRCEFCGGPAYTRSGGSLMCLSRFKGTPCAIRPGDARPTPPPAETGGERVEVLPLVVADLTARIAKGAKQYGEPLTTRNGRDALRDAYEEAMDLALYLKQELTERAERAQPTPDPRGVDAEAVRAAALHEYVEASLAWWRDESPEAERMEGPAWERFHAAFYALPVDVRRGAR